MNSARWFVRLSIAFMLVLPAAGFGQTPSPCQKIEGRDWTFVASGKHPFKLWSTCTGTYQADLRAVLPMAEEKWGAIRNYLGRDPLPDVGGAGADGGPQFDIYLLNVPTTDAASADFYQKEVDRLQGNLCALLPEFETAPRGGACHAISADAVAQVLTSLPLTAGRASAFMLLRRNQVGSADFVFSLTHELFHAFQLNFNHTAAFPPTGAHWFVEASAVWAEWYFNRANPAIANAVHRQKFERFQNDERPLNDPLHGHTYVAYVWPLFMTAAGRDDKVAAAWKAMEGRQDWKGLDEAIDQQFSFADNFRKFALQNLNATFAGISPASTRYTNPDPALPDIKPAFAYPPEELKVLRAAAPPFRVKVSVPTLRAAYYRFTVSDEVKQLRIDFSKLVPAGDVDVDALVKVRGKPWELRPLSGNAKVRFCRMRAEERIDEIYFVVSNHQKLVSIVNGNLEMRPLAEDCFGWGGTIETVREVKPVNFESTWKSPSGMPPETRVTRYAYSSFDRVSIALMEDASAVSYQSNLSVATMVTSSGLTDCGDGPVGFKEVTLKSMATTSVWSGPAKLASVDVDPDTGKYFIAVLQSRGPEHTHKEDRATYTGACAPSDFNHDNPFDYTSEPNLELSPSFSFDSDEAKVPRLKPPLSDTINAEWVRTTKSHREVDVPDATKDVPTTITQTTRIKLV